MASPKTCPAPSTANTDPLSSGDLYSAALAFVRGELQVSGDLIEAVRSAVKGCRRNWRHKLMARLSPLRLESWLQTRSRAVANIRSHYDRSNDFYRQFLDSRMVYSCAYFKEPEWGLDRAQLAKLDYICRKLELDRGERFLDIGCGWGALVCHAASAYGAAASGCTLSLEQYDYAARAIAAERLESRAVVLMRDYRDLDGKFDKIASVGMFEHVGRRRLRGYFRWVNTLLADRGLFLNHGIMRPQGTSESVESLLRRKVFPGGELPHLGDVIREAENAGFEVLDVENLRPHYALTCRAWVERLRANEAACLEQVDAKTYRTWLLFLAGSAVNFEDGQIDVYQVLMAKRNFPMPRKYNREHMRVP